MAKSGLCALCGQVAELQNSHLISNFVIAWQKKMSVKGRLLQASNPTVPQQQGRREHLLCRMCEQQFGIWESLFAKRIFKRFHAGYSGDFAYGDWLLRYAISQAWRTAITVSTGLFRLEEPLAMSFVDNALATWRNYLLNRQADPGPDEHHLWCFDVKVKGPPPVTPDYRYYYLHSGTDMMLSCRAAYVHVYTKLPGMVLWSTIHPAHAVGWKKTLINTNGGVIGRDQGVTDRQFLDFFFDRVEHANALYQHPS